ncbi:hypothetical protein [Gilvimarinus sp. 1_MG-2023]|uniref:hypothetical protein n=1 Tax=Gilvimarinus sp. 1_MG-2023 TaxID=3062638 RepID=UPI0026E1684F|nr:hypothetical protein [Gilvimarinus sp. 1_MG-2023]MDO6746839.1 hypothetical protein [Gilvimarinus sp. 1_MG-2023]
MKYLPSFTVFLAVSTLTLSGHTQAHQPRADYGLVIHSEPVYETRVSRQPVQHCTSSKGSRAHTVIGGAIGSIVGLHQQRDHKGALIGGLIGAGIGHSIDRHSTSKLRHCSTQFQTQRQTVVTGYRVTYRYHGDTYSMVTPHKPGHRIELHGRQTPKHASHHRPQRHHR